MRFADIAGQERAKERLLTTFKEGRVSHALLFAEEQGSGALPLAIAFAQYINCPHKSEVDSCGNCSSCNKFNKLIHADLHFAMPVNSSKRGERAVSDTFLSHWRELFAENIYFTEQQWYKKIDIENKSGLIGVAEANLILKKFSLLPFESGSKFLIVWLPERMNLEAANRLLKTIEEPPEKSYIFMVSETPERIIPTILSRAQLFRVPPIEEESLYRELKSRYNLTEEQGRFWAKISRGSITKAEEMILNSQENSQLQIYLAQLLESSHSKELNKLIEFWESIAATGREYQKSFLLYLLQFLRACLMLSLEQRELAALPPAQMQFAIDWSAKIPPQFYERAYQLIDRALEEINLNVNSRYLFADLANRFFLSL